MDYVHYEYSTYTQYCAHYILRSLRLLRICSLRTTICYAILRIAPLYTVRILRILTTTRSFGGYATSVTRYIVVLYAPLLATLRRILRILLIVAPNYALFRYSVRRAIVGAALTILQAETTG